MSFRLPKIAVQKLDQFFRGLPLLGRRIDEGIDHVESDMILKDFRHESLHGAPNRDKLLEHSAALGFRLQQARDAIHLTANTVRAIE